MPSAKIIGVFLLFSLLNACASLPGVNSSSKAASEEEMSAARSRVASLEAEVTTLKTENAELEKQLLAAQAQRDQLAAEAEGAEDADADVTTAALPETQTVDIPAPQLRNQAVVDEANAPELAQTDVPIEDSPRLVQPAFASNEMVFENEAEGEIPTASVLFGVHLASYRLAEEAREGWRKLQRENPDELGLVGAADGADFNSRHKGIVSASYWRRFFVQRKGAGLMRKPETKRAVLFRCQLSGSKRLSLN